MRHALIGDTGFVGSNLRHQASFQEQFHSSNIQDIHGHSYDLLVCAGAPATKWKANQYPEEDWANIQSLINHLSSVKAKYFVLISTVDVYPTPSEVDENSPITPSLAEPYGKHRYFLEEFVRQNFSQNTIVRLPGLFGTGLKKNFIYDLIYNNCLQLTHKDSVFQFYNLNCLWRDLQRVMAYELPLVNFATEPVRAQDLARECFNLHFDNVTERPPVNYDMRSQHAHVFGVNAAYFSSAQETFSQIRSFVSKQAKTNGI